MDINLDMSNVHSVEKTLQRLIQPDLESLADKSEVLKKHSGWKQSHW